MTERVVGIGDPIPSFVVAPDGKIIRQVKTVLEIRDEPGSKTEIDALFDEIESRYWQAGHTTVCVQAGKNLADDPKVSPLVDVTKVYIVET